MTSSWLVAKKFGKRHDNVMKAIENLKRGLLQIEHTPCKFIESTYTHPQNGVTYSLYVMNQDAFTLLVMGFTGQDALQFKVDYIKQFNAMRDYILKQKVNLPVLPTPQHLTPEQEAKIRYADACIESDVPTSFKGIAGRIMLTNGKKMTRPQLMAWLFNNGYLQKDDNILYCPTQWAIDMGYFMIKIGRRQIRTDRAPRNGKDKGVPTPKGVMHIIDVLSHSLPTVNNQ